ncbi:MAG: hypothetical protein ACR2KJ_18880 [Jatrophihabitans sp.]
MTGIPASDPRAVTEYRIPATDLKTGDLVNTSPGGPDDWQRVLAVHAKGSSSNSDIATLMRSIGDRYVMVELTDVAPVDSNVYLAEGAVMVFGTDGDDDAPVADVVSSADEKRTYLYTVHELVSVRASA